MRLSISYRMPFPETFPCLLRRAIPTLGVVRACFHVLFRDLRSACHSRSTPFLNIHWYENVSLGRALRLMGYSIPGCLTRQNKPEVLCNLSTA
jgi:hypothetical protein